MHLYLLGIYFLRDDTSKAETHAKAVFKIAYENKYYFPLATYYRYFVTVLNPIILNYPEDFRRNCTELIYKYDENLNAFLSSTGEYSVMSNLKDTDYPYVYAIMMNLSNTEIAKRMNVSPTTIRRRLDAIFIKLNVSNKKEMKEFLKKNM